MPTRIKRYEDRIERYDALLARIEAEMGPEAELTAREFRRGGLLGLFGGQRMVEVVATLEVNLDEAASVPSVVRKEPRLKSPAAPAPPAIAPGGMNEPAAATSRPRTAPPLTHADVTRVDLQADAPISLEQAPATAAPARTARGKEALQQPELAAKPPAEHSAAAPQVIAEPDQPAEPAAPGPPSAAPAAIESGPVAAIASAVPTAPNPEISELKQTISELRGTVELLLAQQQTPPAPRLDAVISGAAEPDHPRGAPAIGELLAPPAQPARTGSGGGHVPGLESSVALDTLMRAPALPAKIADPLALDQGADLNAVQRRVYDRLLYWNVGTYEAIELINSALASWQEQGQPDEQTLLKLIFREICRNILLSGGIQLRRTPPGKAVALIGATGVGKTTTIAKLAAYFTFQQGRRVSLVSLDNYRIAAAEQLRTYTEIMGIDLDIVFSRDEFDSVMTQRRQGDLVLIDTAGRSPLNSKQIYELREMFSAHPPDEVHLVVSATTKSDDLRGMLENFLPLSYDHVIVSKLDETQSLGCVYNLTRLTQTPISYFTIGQSVPEDIRPATLPFVQAWIEQGRIR